MKFNSALQETITWHRRDAFGQGVFVGGGCGIMVAASIAAYCKGDWWLFGLFSLLAAMFTAGIVCGAIRGRL